MRNLSAEMTRNGVSISDIQNLLGCSERTVKNKIAEETDFSFPETVKIRNEFFPGMRLEYLFATDNTKSA